MNVDEIYDNNIVRDEQQFGEKNMNVDTEEHNNNIHKAENDGVSTGKYKLKRKRGRKGIKQINEGESRSGVINKTGTRKNCAKWTVDLHSKFTKAVEQLGQGKCYPADIVEVMNVPDLTRKQVSSHLQGDHHDYGLDNHTQNGYGLDLNPAHVTTHSGNTMITNTNVGNVTLNGLGATNTNFQQDIGEENMFDPSNIVANDIEGSDPNEWKYWDAFVDYYHMGDLFQNPTSSSAILPNEHGSSKDIGGPVFKNSKFPDE
ncbi:hypothetical protein MTR67_053669 [Solanum verrucosum]|uniref:Myb-like domain-containing protein n=1 Tax=Solanum verrucosum TaxID=315347 RepID=A0AAF0VAD2_SOLVR|nr:hypothetical protein MTR67_053669 [Solanum verrucosum]